MPSSELGSVRVSGSDLLAMYKRARERKRRVEVGELRTRVLVLMLELLYQAREPLDLEARAHLCR